MKNSYNVLLVIFIIVITLCGVMVFTFPKIMEHGQINIENLKLNKPKQSIQTYNNSYTEQYTDSADSKLKSVLRDIAGTYELVENKGIYGFTTVYVVSINQDGTGRMVNSDGSVETFSSARLSGSNKIVFSGNYGGTVFLLSGEGIEDESAKRYVTEAGTPKYIMRKR